MQKRFNEKMGFATGLTKKGTVSSTDKSSEHEMNHAQP
jgi:hypothetical protein